MTPNLPAEPLEAAHPFPAPIGGGGRIRTYEGVSRQIYSLLPLAAWVPLREIEPRILISGPRGVNASWRAICWDSGPQQPFFQSGRAEGLTSGVSSASSSRWISRATNRLSLSAA